MSPFAELDADAAPIVRSEPHAVAFSNHFADGGMVFMGSHGDCGDVCGRLRRILLLWRRPMCCGLGRLDRGGLWRRLRLLRERADERTHPPGLHIGSNQRS